MENSLGNNSKLQTGQNANMFIRKGKRPRNNEKFAYNADMLHLLVVKKKLDAKSQQK